MPMPDCLIGSLGASAVLVYVAVRSPLAQPRNLVGGHVVPALVGVLAWKLLVGVPWLAAAVAVPATALIAVMGSEDIHTAGFAYVLMPATLGLVDPAGGRAARQRCGTDAASR